MPEPQKVAYFVGAGATCADFEDVPLMGGLFDAILKDISPDDPLVVFLRTVFEASSVETPGDPSLRPRIDDVFTLIEAGMNSEIHFPSTWTSDDLIDVRDRLIAGIGRVINEHLTEPSGLSAHRFAHGINPKSSTVISTNYDICIDNAMLSAGNVNYGLTIRSAVHRSGAILKGRPEEMIHFKPLPGDQAYIRRGPIPLLKLHGSLNWLYCARCRELDITLEEPGGLTVLNSPQIGRCGTAGCTQRYEALLVGPSLMQRYAHPVLRTTWDRANAALSEADRLIIIGYSLPESDYLIRCLLARHFARRSKGVEVVTIHSTEDPAEDARLERRYRQLFPSCSFFWDGFDEYAMRWPSSGEPIKDQGPEPEE